MPWQEISCPHWQGIAASTRVPGDPALRIKEKPG
jgi:hypothetical protein